MRNHNYQSPLSLLATCLAMVLALSAEAQVIETGLFTNTHLRECPHQTACLGGDPTIEWKSAYDLSNTGSIRADVVSKWYYIPTSFLWVQGGTSVGYSGEALTPKMSGFARPRGPHRFTQGAFGFQKYTFLQDGTVSFRGKLLYTQSGQTIPIETSPRGRVRAYIATFQLDGDEFDGQDCNIFSRYDAPNTGALLSNCIAENGQPFGNTVIEFAGLKNAMVNRFDIPITAANGGAYTDTITIQGTAGEVFFVAADFVIQAHLDGYVDLWNSLDFEVVNAEILEPSFKTSTYEPVSPRFVEMRIKPEDETACMNINGAGVVPVAILADPPFMAEQIDPLSLSLGGLEVRINNSGKPLCHLSLVNDDSYPDMVCKFEDNVDNWAPDGDSVVLTGALMNDSLFVSTEPVCLRP